MNALSPAKVISIEIDEEEHKATIEVEDDQLSLAIGKGGQNVRLAAKLTGWKIDIKGDGKTVQPEPDPDTEPENEKGVKEEKVKDSDTKSSPQSKDTEEEKDKEEETQPEDSDTKKKEKED